MMTFEKFKTVKWYSKGKLEIDENSPDIEEEDNDEVWAIFIIKDGKFYITFVNDNDVFAGWAITKYSDPKVQKFTLDRAKELVNKNDTSYNRYGIVNNKGLQLTKSIYDKQWHRI